jgi:hypothetical protein
LAWAHREVQAGEQSGRDIIRPCLDWYCFRILSSQNFGCVASRTARHASAGTPYSPAAADWEAGEPAGEAAGPASLLLLLLLLPLVLLPLLLRAARDRFARGEAVGLAGAAAAGGMARTGEASAAAAGGEAGAAAAGGEAGAAAAGQWQAARCPHRWPPREWACPQPREWA